MYKDKTFLAIIPARGGSKRLPRKNVLDLAGKPLIVWTIEAGLQSKYIDKVVVSSDDDEILEISKQCGAEIVKRADELASDTATTVDVLLDVINNIDQEYDYVVLLQPTSPLRNENHIDDAIEFLYAKNADAIISVCEMDHSPLWSNTLPESLNMNNFIREELKNKRSQDLETYYRLNGAIYIISVQKLLKEKTLFIENNIYAYLMDRYTSIDIDKKFDLDIAHFFMSKIK